MLFAIPPFPNKEKARIWYFRLVGLEKRDFMELKCLSWSGVQRHIDK